MTSPTLWLAEITVHDGSSATVRRYSNLGFTTTPSETPASTHYPARLLQPITAARNIFRAGGATRGTAETTKGELILGNGDGELDSIFATGAVDGRSLIVRQGVPGAAYPAGFTTVFDGTMYGQPELHFDRVVLRARGREQELDIPLQDTFYAGDNVLPDGVEGTAELTGKPKPVCYGKVRNVPAVCVNTSKLIYQVHDGAIDSLDAVRDSGIALTANGPWEAPVSSPHSGVDILRVGYGNSLYLIDDNNSGNIYTSSDLSSWTSRTPGFGAGWEVAGFAYINSLYILVGYNTGTATASAYSSPDGVTWTLRTLGFAANQLVANLKIVNGIAVAVGANGWISTTTDGTTWSAVQVGTSLWRDITYGNGLYVLAGHAGAVRTSPNLSTWTVATIASAVSTTDLYLLAFGNGRFVVMGNTFATGAFMATSADGVVWLGAAFTSPGGSIAFTTLAFANGLFRAGTSGTGYILTSTDGDTWTPTDSPFGQVSVIANLNGRWFAAGFGSNQYAVTSTSTDVATSADLEDDLAAPPAGGFVTCLSEGLFRLGSTPAGQVTSDVTEGATSADRTVAQVWKRLLQDRASMVSGTDFSASDITTLDSACSGEIGYWRGLEPVSLSSVLDEVAGTAGAWWLPDRTGIYRLKQLVAPSGSAAQTFVAADLKSRIERRPSTDPGEGIPCWKVVLYYSRNYAVQTNGLAGGVEDAARALFEKEWKSVTAEDSSILTKHLLAPTLPVYTLFADEADAQDEADRQLALRKVQRDRYPLAVECDATSNQRDLGDVVSLQHSRYGLSAGKKFVIVGVEPNAKDRSLSLELWGNVA